MKLAHELDRNPAANPGTRNPFGVMDVPNPDDQTVKEFAASATLDGAADDANATAWSDAVGETGHGDSIEGDWSSRWNGAADPTISGDAADKWKAGQG